MENVKYLVYENWRAEKKAVVHKSLCGYTTNGQGRLNICGNNDKWYGFFNSFNEAVAFAALLPDRPIKLCKHCLENEINGIISHND